jgi:hypothetical protein
MYKGIKKIEDGSTTYLPCVESVINDKGLVHQV